MAAMDFLPEDYVAAKSRSRANLLCFALFVVVMVGIGWAFVVNQQQDAEVEELDRQINQTLAYESRKLARMQELTLKKQSMLEKARVTGLLLQRVPRSLILAELTNAMPKECSWLGWKLDSKEVRPRGASGNVSRLQARLMERRAAAQAAEKVVTLTIEGLSPTDLEVSNFMAAIKHCPLFDNVNLISTVEHKQGDEILRRFVVQLELAEDAEEHVEALAAKQKAAHGVLGTSGLNL